MTADKCKNCKQTKTIFTKGVCGECFKILLEDVTDGVTTWDKLDAKKLVDNSPVVTHSNWSTAKKKKPQK